MTQADRRRSRSSLTLSGRVVLANLGNLRLGDLRIVWCDGTEHDFHGDEPGPYGEIAIRDPAAARRMVLGGSIGFAEGYLDGTWTTPDLVALLELLSANIVARGRHHRSPLRPMHNLLHLLRVNTRRGARKNVSYHYDLGNEFYRLWLDPTMTYSCGLFQEGLPSAADRPIATLEQAQVAKWDRLLSLIDPLPGSSLLEIGCGWGGFAIHAAQARDCRVTGITLSEEQLTLATERAREAGLADRVRFRLQDYRDVRETFDHIASIEMFEAVGEIYWPLFFQQLRACLRPGGRAALQVITIDDDRFDAYRTRADFIQKYVFPGGMLPSPRAFENEAAAAGLVTGPPSFFAASYAATLSCWLDRFDAAGRQIAALGFDDRFIRMWRYYLAYCIAGFRNGMIDVMQVALT